jgi:hypothetical protein
MKTCPLCHDLLLEGMVFCGRCASDFISQMRDLGPQIAEQIKSFEAEYYAQEKAKSEAAELLGEKKPRPKIMQGPKMFSWFWWSMNACRFQWLVLECVVFYFVVRLATR